VGGGHTWQLVDDQPGDASTSSWDLMHPCHSSRGERHDRDQGRAEADIVLVGAGIMSMTLAVLLKELQPSLKIEIIEALASEAQESSNAWNTPAPAMRRCASSTTRRCAGRQHRHLQGARGQYRVRPFRQFWSYLIGKGAIATPDSFIHPVPHMSFVHGADRVAYLKKRHAALTAHHCYFGMEYTEDKKQLAEWAPLVMEGRDPGEAIAATHMVTGSDVNYGALTSNLLAYLKTLDASPSSSRSVS